MKKNLNFLIERDAMIISPDGLMEYRIQHVTFTKKVKDENNIVHHARIITYADVKKATTKLVSLLTNDMEMDPVEIVKVYKKKMDYWVK